MAKFASIGACSKKPLIEARSHHGQSFVRPVAIEEGSGKRPIHPLQVLARAYGAEDD